MDGDEGLKVIGAGFGRTGTYSLKNALEELGYPCYHMTSVLGTERAKQWLRVATDEGYRDWPAIFKGFTATVDWPGCSYWRELADAYPDAKVVLHTRDPDAWYQSVFDTIYTPQKLAPSHPMRRVLDALLPVEHAMGRAIIWEGAFDGRFGDKAYALEKMRQHERAVRAGVPPERLLVYSVKEGWGPLCEFLGKPVPATPFPHLNAREGRKMGKFQNGFVRSMLLRKLAIKVLAPLLVALLAIYFAFSLHRGVRGFS